MKAVALALPLLLGFCAPDETVSGYADRATTWRLETLGAADFRPDTELRFPREGVVEGRGPCNGFTATQDLPYPWIGITNLTATRAACPDLDAEALFFATLEAATLVEVSPTILILTDNQGQEAVFRAATSP